MFPQVDSHYLEGAFTAEFWALYIFDCFLPRCM